MEINDKLRELLGSEAFAKEAESARTAEDIQTVLNRHGIKMTIGEVIELGEKINRLMVSGENRELSEDDLEDVSGGGLWDWIKSWFNKLAKKNTDDINDILSRL